MISQMHLGAGKQVQGLKRTYLGDANGYVDQVEEGDLPALLAAGATPVVHPATLDLVVGPHRVINFDGETRTADEHGLVLGVRHNPAKAMIDDKSHPARLATVEDLARAGYHTREKDTDGTGHIVEIDADELGEIRALAAQADAIFKALSARFDGAEIVDTGEVTGAHEDMIFSVQKDGVEIASGTVTELFARAVPAHEAPVALAAAEADETKPVIEDEEIAEDDEADVDEGDLLPETASASK